MRVLKNSIITKKVLQVSVKDLNIRPPGAGYRELEYIEGAFPSPKLDAKTKNRPNHQNWTPKPKKPL